MNYSLMLKIWSNDLIEIILGIVGPKPFDNNTKPVFIMLWKFGRTKLTLDFCLSKKIQETLVQSLMKDTNQYAPNILGIREGPQISL